MVSGKGSIWELDQKLDENIDAEAGRVRGMEARTVCNLNALYLLFKLK
jgi:hypothetical protein